MKFSLNVRQFLELFWVCGFVFYHSLYGSAVENKTAIMRLSDIKPGMKGEWHTVVEGNEIKKFPLEVIDTMSTFVGPAQPAIFCRGLDEGQQKIGTVAGMSGSPVYIEGQLIGAYAYGFPWPKEQVLIGVSPIESMFQVLDYESAANIIGENTPIPKAFPEAVPLSAENRSREISPLLVGVGGFSSTVLDRFRQDWLDLGFSLNHLAAVGGSGSVKSGNSDDQLVPGASVAAVLLGGDFKVAAVGVVTWREGNTLLAMGHPFLAQGNVKIPMATANILDIVQSYETSFKLAKVGDVVGSFFQDRLTAMAGRVGLMAPVTNLLFNVTNTEGVKKTYQGDLFHNRDLGPLVASMALSQVLQSTLDGGVDQSYVLKTTIEIENSKSVTQTFYAYGSTGPDQVARAFLKDLRLLLNNRYCFPNIKKITFDIRFEKGIKRIELVDVQVVSGKPKPGGNIRLQLTLQDFLGDKRLEYVQLYIPANRPKGAMQIRIGDVAIARDAYEGVDPLIGFRSFEDIVQYLNQRRSNAAFYVQLVQETKGIHFGGRSLSDLPRSVFACYDTPKAWFKAGFLDARILDEVILPQVGFCIGGPCIFDLIIDY